MEPSGLTPWAVLGIPEDAPLRDARRAFRHLAKRTHPDVGGDSRAFAAVARAYREIRPRLGRAARPTPYDWAVRPPRATRSWAEPRPTRNGRRGLTNTGRTRAFPEMLADELARLADAA